MKTNNKKNKPPQVCRYLVTVQGLSWIDDVKTDKDVYESISRLRNMGYKRVLVYKLDRAIATNADNSSKHQKRW